MTPGGGWRKSSHSINGGHCTEVRPDEGAVRVRDSQDPDGPELQLTPQAWREFCATLQPEPEPRRGRLILGKLP